MSNRMTRYEYEQLLKDHNPEELGYVEIIPEPREPDDYEPWTSPGIFILQPA